MTTGVFDCLAPEVVISAVEQILDIKLYGTIVPYPSYINRVYGLTDDEGRGLVAKFYRPGRWQEDALLDEHQFILDLDDDEIPVAVPIKDDDGETLFEAEAVTPEGETSFYFTVFPKRAGRNFDINTDDDWLRLGRLVGRMHTAGRKRRAPVRLICAPGETTARYIAELLDEGLIHPDCTGDFERITGQVLNQIVPLFEDIRLERLHGDCHRGNILDRPGEGLLLIDFDDMMRGPAVQDLWLLLPDHAQHAVTELSLLLTGYREFLDFDLRELRLIEPLRFMRMIYYLAWCARQRNDAGFSAAFPSWGSKAFWIKELEDLEEQASVIFSEPDITRFV
ncbi:MAG: serine/threonine protein kinase [Spirochaetia bacterium]